jgi:flagellar biosynthesis protein FlhF
VHLVLSAACGEGVLAETIDRFGGVGVDRVIFTKLDEAVGFGVILNCLQKVKAQLSYVTTGQDVPNDIEEGEGRSIAELILGNRGHLTVPEAVSGGPAPARREESWVA